MNLNELQSLLTQGQAEPSAEPRGEEGAPVKLVPRRQDPAATQDDALPPAASLKERLQEVELALKLGYLLCKCTWPPQIMVLTGVDHVYRCRRCSRVREM